MKGPDDVDEALEKKIGRLVRLDYPLERSLCLQPTLVVDSPERQDVRDNHRLVCGRVDALDSLGVEVLEEELFPHFPPEI